jgi:hypothetical protein
MQWLLLLHQIPPSPPYFRAKVLRRLNQLGALAIKNSAYVIPETEETIEDIQWLRSEIESEGGEAWLFRADPMSGLNLESEFQKARSSDYKQLLQDMKRLLPKDESELRRLKRRFEEIRRIDFFSAPGREDVETLMETIERKLHGPAHESVAKPDFKNLTGRIWVTRRGVKVDRIGSAWLIRRFIDPAANFRFVDPDQYQHQPDEIRFDMFEGEFTHEGDLCTFETLLRHANLADAALAGVAEIVHDIDVKDEKYQRPQTSGISALIQGIMALHASDERRIEEGSRIFEATYTAFRAKTK